MVATPLTHPEGRRNCLSGAVARHELVIKAPAHASAYSFAVSRIVPSSLRLAGDPPFRLRCVMYVHGFRLERSLVRPSCGCWRAGLGRVPGSVQIARRKKGIVATFADPSRTLQYRRDTSVLLTGWARDLASGLNVCFDGRILIC